MMALPTKEQIAASADYLYGVLRAQMSDNGWNFKDGRSDTQRCQVIDHDDARRCWHGYHAGVD
jgi:hypothetical protein